MAMRARKGLPATARTRQPINRSRSGDGLLRVRRSQQKRRTPLVAVVVVFLVVTIIVVVATVHNTLQEGGGQIRTGTKQQHETNHNSDERPSDDRTTQEQDDDQTIKAPRDNFEDPVAGQEIRQEADREDVAAQEARLREEARRREEEIEREETRRREEEIRQQQLSREDQAKRQREEEERRQREDEERRRKEKEELERKQKEEEEARQRLLEEEARQSQRPRAQRAHHHEKPQNEDAPHIPGVNIPEQQEVSFCEIMRKKPSTTAMDLRAKDGYSNPAILVLGMEDTSTDLVWHVLSQILYPSSRHPRQQHAHEVNNKATAVEYDLLNRVGANDHTEFWSNVSDKSHGKWLVHVFCQQQEHNLATGFPWLTHPDQISKNQKAHDSLEVLKQLPLGAVKVLRIKRNPLDVVIREARRDKGTSKATLNKKKIFSQLRKLQQEQDAVDQYLHAHSIPHLTLDFESLFPFDHWTHLVEETQAYQSSPNHINIDWRQLSSQLEATWRDVLRYLDVVQPLTMFDILHDAMQTHEVNTFWIQKDAVDKFAYIEQTLLGTRFQHFMRKPRPRGASS